MPIVQIDMLEGRSLEQKRKMVQEITDAIARNCNCSVDAVTIVIRESPREHIAKGGTLLSEKQ